MTERDAGFIKICGITCEDDALLAVAMGADAVGFIFAPSTSQITPSRAREIARRLPPHILTVGVFRNEAPERVIDIISTAGLGAAQLHGQESSHESMAIARSVPAVVKAFGAGDPDIDRAAAFGAAAVLVDNVTPGSGEVFDWRLLDSGSARTKMILAGGLGPENVADAIAQVHPWGVDSKSGVEASPGRKDPMKVRQFVLNARTAFSAMDAEDVARSPQSPSVDGAIYDWLDE
ncbi:MAG: phosphoribosylanthranilate isomerase [Actinomycetia bacterium]|nr:phosphoribosylanthranilate isomerase [Actinomycetes bacterium]MCP4958928.1 phosphoribosylanthranilate isomerase [Actinomycetes bacterium]